MLAYPLLREKVHCCDVVWYLWEFELSLETLECFVLWF